MFLVSGHQVLPVVHPTPTVVEEPGLDRRVGPLQESTIYPASTLLDKHRNVTLTGTKGNLNVPLRPPSKPPGFRSTQHRTSHAVQKIYWTYTQ